MSSIVGVIEVGVYVDDLAVAEKFYQDVLQLELIGREAGRHVFFKAGNSVVLLFNPTTTLRGDVLPAHGAAGATHFALGIERDGLDYWRQRLSEYHVEIEKEMDWPRGGHSLYFRDPAGNSLELVTPGLWGLPGGW